MRGSSPGLALPCSAVISVRPHWLLQTTGPWEWVRMHTPLGQECLWCVGWDEPLTHSFHTPWPSSHILRGEGPGPGVWKPVCPLPTREGGASELKAYNKLSLMPSCWHLRPGKGTRARLCLFIPGRPSPAQELSGPASPAGHVSSPWQPLHALPRGRLQVWSPLAGRAETMTSPGPRMSHLDKMTSDPTLIQDTGSWLSNRRPSPKQHQKPDGLGKGSY